MTDRYSLYLISLGNRDQTLIALAGIALALIVAYLAIPKCFPSRWVPIMRRIYLGGGIVLYIATMVATIWGTHA